jgi:hypothetical protein
MLIVEMNALSNGAHRNQIGDFKTVPDGWVLVPSELEADAMQMLPFIDLIFEGGQLASVVQGEIPAPAPSPDPAPTTEEDLMAMGVDHEYRLTLLELGVI